MSRGSECGTTVTEASTTSPSIPARAAACARASEGHSSSLGTRTRRRIITLTPGEGSAAEAYVCGGGASSPQMPSERPGSSPPTGECGKGLRKRTVAAWNGPPLDDLGLGALALLRTAGWVYGLLVVAAAATAPLDVAPSLAAGLILPLTPLVLTAVAGHLLAARGRRLRVVPFALAATAAAPVILALRTPAATASPTPRSPPSRSPPPASPSRSSAAGQAGVVPPADGHAKRRGARARRHPPRRPRRPARERAPRHGPLPPLPAPPQRGARPHRRSPPASTSSRRSSSGPSSTPPSRSATTPS